MVFIEGSDELSSDERSTLTDAFRLVNVEEYARMATDDIIGSLVLARGPAGVTDGFARFDVSHENFAEIVDLLQADFSDNKTVSPPPFCIWLQTEHFFSIHIALAL